MRSIAFLVLCLALLPTHTFAGDGPVLSLTGSGIDPVDTSDVSLVVAATADAGEFIQYCWSAIPGTSASPVANYRYGWDIQDPADPDSPGWAVPETAFDGSEVCAPLEAFLTGTHNFVAQVRDQAGVATRITVQIQLNEVVPVPVRSWSTIKGGH